jgi:hypothetical protein
VQTLSVTSATTHDDAKSLWNLSLKLTELFALISEAWAADRSSAKARDELAATLTTSVADLAEAIRSTSAHLDAHVKWQAEWPTVIRLIVVGQRRNREAISILRGCLEELDRSHVCTKRAFDLDRSLERFVEMVEKADRIGVHVSADELEDARAGLYAAAKALGASVRQLDRSRDEVASIVRAADAGAFDQDAESSSMRHVETVSRAMEELRARARATGQAAFLGDAPILDD